MAEGDRTNDDAADAGTGGGGRLEEEGAARPTSGAEATGNDPAGFEPAGVGDPRQQGEGGGGESTRPGDWNPGEQSGGGGGELY